MQDDRRPQEYAGQTAREADVGEIQRDGRAVGQHAGPRRARPAGDPKAIRAMPATRATGMAMPVSSSPNNNRPTSDWNDQQRQARRGFPHSGKISTHFIAPYLPRLSRARPVRMA